MTNIIWSWRFPSEKEVNNRKKKFSQLIRDNDIDQKVTDIKEYKYWNIAVEIQDFWDEIIEIIDKIIDNWINRYKSFTWDDKTYTQETTEIWEEMFQRARWIEDMAEYINDDEDWELEIEQWYILESINNILNPYSSIVFEKLMYQKEKNNH